MYVYFIKANCDCPLIKIGKARNPEERLRVLQVGSPLKLSLMGTVRCKSDYHATQVEKFAHNIFYKQRRHGEWFKLSGKHKAQIESLITRAASQQVVPE